MSDYYPEFYLRKRQREQAYRRATVITVGILVMLVIGGIVGYLVINAVTTRRTAPGATPELAVQQQELQTQQQLASAEIPEGMETIDQPAVELGDISYSESFPKVSVSLSGVTPGDDAAAASSDAAEAAEGQAEPAGANGSSPDSSVEQEPPSAQDQRVGAVSPAGDEEARRKAEQEKRKEEARREAEKREAARRAEEQRRREEDKSKAAAEKPAEPAADAQDSRAPAQPAGYTYTVYGGTFLSEDAAEQKKAELGALGLSGSIIKAGGDHLLLIGKFDDQDSATALRNKLTSSGFGGAFVTRKAK